MYDIERITKIIADIERYFKDMEKLNVKSADMSSEQFYSLSMLLFALLNRAIDLGNELIKANDLGLPISYKEIFIILGKNKLISRELEVGLVSLSGLRNVLSHQYYDVTKERIFGAYKKIDAVMEFSKAVKKLMLKK
ncbi:MAG: DUF86 domain-containing protein [Nanoarchaeota archaeon]|nr:DUF86 domain-containing protein [Nanoarchaeota archaeon]